MPLRVPHVRTKHRAPAHQLSFRASDECFLRDATRNLLLLSPFVGALLAASARLAESRPSAPALPWQRRIAPSANLRFCLWFFIVLLSVAPFAESKDLASTLLFSAALVAHNRAFRESAAFSCAVIPTRFQRGTCFCLCGCAMPARRGGLAFLGFHCIRMQRRDFFEAAEVRNIKRKNMLHAVNMHCCGQPSVVNAHT